MQQEVGGAKRHLHRHANGQQHQTVCAARAPARGSAVPRARRCCDRAAPRAAAYQRHAWLWPWFTSRPMCERTRVRTRGLFVQLHKPSHVLEITTDFCCRSLPTRADRPPRAQVPQRAGRKPGASPSTSMGTRSLALMARADSVWLRTTRTPSDVDVAATVEARDVLQPEAQTAVGDHRVEASVVEGRVGRHLHAAAEVLAVADGNKRDVFDGGGTAVDGRARPSSARTPPLLSPRP